MELLQPACIKKFVLVLTLAVSVHLAPELMAHGMGGHSHGPSSGGTATVDPHAGHDHAPGDMKSVVVEQLDEKIWGAYLETGWESKHIHYGVNETGNGSLYYTEVGVSVYDFSLTAWGGFGLGTRFQEWDFTAAYNLELGPVFIVPGFNFRWDPYGDGHEDHEDHDEHGDHDDHDHDQDDHDEEGHQHAQYGYELFVVVGTTALPYVTPSVGFLWDLASGSGGYMEFRLDGEIPFYKDIISINPYTLLSLNFGYNTREYYGWNNWQLGVEGIWNLTQNISAFAGVNYSVAMTALSEIDQGNEFWVNVGVSFSY